MEFYRAKTPGWLKMLFPRELVWKMPATERPAVYLTFDDGPHPEATPFVLNCLMQYGARATFFCIGKNVVQYPEIYARILSEGHAVGNHTHHHLNGWKNDQETYLKDIEQASTVIDSRIFRPPYGRIRAAQVRALTARTTQPWRIYMWDVLSADFDQKISPQQCLKNVTDNIIPGSIIVFHDSEKAFQRMSYALPKVLGMCAEKGWETKTLP